MTIRINQIISNILNEDRSVKSSTTRESYLIIPDNGKVLINKNTKEIKDGIVSVNTRNKISEYEEIIPIKDKDKI